MNRRLRRVGGEKPREKTRMKAETVDYFAEYRIEDREQGSPSMHMDYDDVDGLDIFQDSMFAVFDNRKIAYKDFFNSFQDDFDDSDIN